MNHLLIAGLVAVLASTAHAGANPDVRIYIDFDPPNYVHEITPEPYTEFSAYVCLDHVPEGVRCVSFQLTDLEEEYPGLVAPPGWTILFPGSLPICYYPWMPGGTTICAEACMLPEGGPVIAGRADFFYLYGGSACLEILDHADYPKWVVDCTDPGAVDYYCVLSHGSISGGDCPSGDCGYVPVETGTWGMVKSLYR